MFGQRASRSWFWVTFWVEQQLLSYAIWISSRVVLARRPENNVCYPACVNASGSRM